MLTLWSHIPETAVVSCTSNGPQNDIGSDIGDYLGVHIAEFVAARSRSCDDLARLGFQARLLPQLTPKVESRYTSFHKPKW